MQIELTQLLDTPTWEKLQRAAQERHTPIEQVVREILTDHFDDASNGSDDIQVTDEDEEGVFYVDYGPEGNAEYLAYKFEDTPKEQVLASLREALEDVKAERGIPAREALDEIKRELGLI